MYLVWSTDQQNGLEKVKLLVVKYQDLGMPLPEMLMTFDVTAIPIWRH